jgi:hypothetical protein
MGCIGDGIACGQEVVLAERAVGAEARLKTHLSS